MPTRTAPAVGALTVTKNIVSLNLVDVSDDTFSEALVLEGGGLTDMAEIQAWAVAYQAATNASLWKVTQIVEWEGTKDPTLATALFRASTESGVNFLFKDVGSLSIADGRLVAPLAAVMDGNLDIPLPASALMAALTSAYMTLLNSGGSAYDIQSMQYTGRRERKNNPRKPA